MKHLILFVLMIALPVLYGCPKIAPDYTGGLGAEPANLKPFENSDAGIRMAIPAGWTAVPVPAGATPS